MRETDNEMRRLAALDSYQLVGIARAEVLDGLTPLFVASHQAPDTDTHLHPQRPSSCSRAS
jgi:hypothetical protein